MGPSRFLTPPPRGNRGVGLQGGPNRRLPKSGSNVWKGRGRTWEGPISRSTLLVRRLTHRAFTSTILLIDDPPLVSRLWRRGRRGLIPAVLEHGADRTEGRGGRETPGSRRARWALEPPSLRTRRKGLPDEFCETVSAGLEMAPRFLFSQLLHEKFYIHDTY